MEMWRTMGLVAVFGAAWSADRPSGQPAQVQRAMTLPVGPGRTRPCSYLLYLPKGYAESKEGWPLVLFLHGAGERGDRLELVKKHGPPMLAEKGKALPFILVSPQCPRDGWWPKETAMLADLLDEVVARHRVDVDRVYVTGLSMGGMGTWALAAAQPRRFAAIAPICGGGDPATAERISHLPVWAFHGARDRVVPLKATQDMVDALKRAGAEPKLTVYPNAGHNSWTAAYDDKQLYEWLASQKRTQPASQPATRPATRRAGEGTD